MAETVAVALWEIGAAWATNAAIALAANATFFNAVAAVAASQAYGARQRRKAQARSNATVADRLVMTATAQAARSRIYGRVRISDGVVFKQTHGEFNKYYTLVVALGAHELDAIEQVYFDENAVTRDADGYVTSAPYVRTNPQAEQQTFAVSGGAGSVVLSQVPIAGSVAVYSIGDGGSIQQAAFTLTGSTVTVSGLPEDGTHYVRYQYGVVDYAARVRAYTGAPGQDLYSVLQPLVGGAVQVSDQFRGIPCLICTLHYDPDIMPRLPSISAVVRGARVFDPRTGTTAWTRNPALCARDWALYAYGGGCSADELRDAAFTAAANACDVSTTFTLASGGSETRPLYQCDIAIGLDGNPDEAMDEIVESMAGQWGWSAGKLALRAGVYRAPVATITEDWIADTEAIQVTTHTATADLVNVMRPTFADAAQAWVETPGAEVRADAYIAADGRELAREFTLGAVTNAVHAQHVCAVLMRENREGLTVVLPCNFRAYQLELFDVVALTLPTFGWSGKPFEVLGWRFSLSAGVQLTLRETAAAIYTPDATFNLITASPNTGLPVPAQVPQITGLSVTSTAQLQPDSAYTTRTVVAWPAPTDVRILVGGRVEVQYLPLGATLGADEWKNLPPADGLSLQAQVFGLQAGLYAVWRARYVNGLGMRGAWSQEVLHVVTTPPDVLTPIVDAVNTKARVFKGPIPPVADNVGDLWVDEDAGNRQYRWDGSAWVSLALGTDGIAPEAITSSSFNYSIGGAVLTPPTGPGAGVDVNAVTRNFTRSGGEIDVKGSAQLGYVCTTASAGARLIITGKLVRDWGTATELVLRTLVVLNVELVSGVAASAPAALFAEDDSAPATSGSYRLSFSYSTTGAITGLAVSATECLVSVREFKR